ncbi:hypothetical protein AB0C65_35970 [Nocardia sp. NPDC048505]|uniref:hypothetical protein n=1 Tax=Nocardia sp. NPDC048505 TaxID=3155756 RepID=UPI0033F465A3
MYHANHVDSARELVALLPYLWGKTSCYDVPDQGIVLILVCEPDNGYAVIERVWTVDGHEQLDQFHARALTYATRGTRVVAVVVDVDADGPAQQNRAAHQLLLDSVACALRGHGARLHAAYATRGFAPTEPVWSLDTDTYLGKVPLFPPIRPYPVYALAEPVTARPADSLPRAAD